MLCFSSFLKIGVTLATFILSGIIPVFSDKLKIFIRGFLLRCKDFLRHLHEYYHSHGFYLPLAKRKYLSFFSVTCSHV